MSELTCEVIEITQLGKLENSDFLSLTHVYSYPCIVKSEAFQVGDKAVYFPVDAMLPEKDVFSFVWKGKESPTDKSRTIRAIRLRGTFSMGLCIPFSEIVEAYPDLDPDEWGVGSNIAEALGVQKYEPPEPMSTGGDNERTPGWLSRYTDIENIRKYHPVLQEGEEIVLTEKIHGANARYVYHEDRLWVGSHNNCKKLGGDDVWNLVAKKLDLAERLQEFPGLVFFGEVYGQVQKGFNYGLKGESALILFDIYSIERGQYLDYDEFMVIAEALQLPVTPMLYRGPWTNLEDFESYADGDSIQAEDSHIREGFVLRPVKERFDDKLGRVVVKLHGQDYLTGKKRKKK